MNFFEHLIKALGIQFSRNPYKLAHKCYYNLACFFTFKDRLWILNAPELCAGDSETYLDPFLTPHLYVLTASVPNCLHTQEQFSVPTVGLTTLSLNLVPHSQSHCQTLSCGLRFSLLSLPPFSAFSDQILLVLAPKYLLTYWPFCCLSYLSLSSGLLQ